MTKRWVMADLHGNYKALLQCLERSKFDKEKDVLIIIGDVVDGYNEVKQCIDKLLELNTIFVRGNHDQWVIDFITTGRFNYMWLEQGGYATLASYGMDVHDNSVEIPKSHFDFLTKSLVYYSSNGQLFVHGGIEPQCKVENMSEDYIMWDRSLFQNAIKKRFDKSDNNYKFVKRYDEVFIGHTTTQSWGSIEPLKACNVWNLDTGAGWSGKLTIMDIDSKEFYQSDLAKELYPGQGRG